MKTILILLVTVLVFNSYSQGQITKGNWLVGGSGRFSSQLLDINSAEVKGTNIKISPNLGHFFVDKFAGGVKLGLSHSKVKFDGGVSKTNQWDIGPFLRYYFLKSENIINLLAEGAYLYSHSTSNNGASDNQNTFSFSAGPVIYFNSSVGIELTATYESLKFTSGSAKAKTIYLNIGFQIHLEKDKNQ